MTGEELRDQFHRLELRLERLDTKAENVEKGLADARAEFRSRFDGLEARLQDKADWRVVTLYTALIVGLMTLYTFVV